MSERPHRIQRQRSKGWRMPDNTVYVGRPTVWGNPHPWKEYEIRARDVPLGVSPHHFAREMAVEDFRADIRSGALPFSVADVRRELRGKNLACWCPKPGACHADVLLELANEVAG